MPKLHIENVTFPVQPGAKRKTVLAVFSHCLFPSQEDRRFVSETPPNPNDPRL
jgi:hypothetical protein